MANKQFSARKKIRVCPNLGRDMNSSVGIYPNFALA